MSALDELLDRLKALPEDVRNQVVADAKAATTDMVWVPNAGPQTTAFFSDADETFYGGQAGGGKTDLAVGLALTAHRRSLLLRRINKDAVKLVSRIEEILGHRNGYNGQLQRWKLDERQIDIAGCEQESDKQRFKGDPHDLICVGRGTPVLLADGSYRKVEDLKAGVMLQTLEGPRRLQRVYPMMRKPAVRMVVRDEDGAVLAEQVQASTHAILTERGWISAADLGGSYGPTRSRDACKPARWLSETCSTLALHLSESIGSLRHMAGLHVLSDPRRSCEASSAGVELVGAGSGFEAFAYALAGARRLPRSSGRGAHPRQTDRSGGVGFAPRSVWSDKNDASLRSSPQGSLESCSNDTRPCGGRTPQSQGSSTFATAVPRGLLRLAGAVRPIPSHSPEGDEGRTQIHSPARDTYPHPYRSETRSVAQSCSLRAAAIEFSDAGVQDVFDLQVDEVNHYITAGGIVNKNCFDEGTDFLESQYRFIIGWNRSAIPGQRCRVLVTSNPPTTAEGLWVIKYWAPWLDDTHPNPAAPGELRWFTTINGEDAEVDGPGPHLVNGEYITARSRTFIPAALSDNPDLAATNYASVLASLPDELRRAYKDGDFSVGLRDADFQVIPTEWIKAAQARWTPQPPQGVLMTAMGFDAAGGGSDAAELAYRYGGWYGPLVTTKGEDTADGSTMAATVMKHRRDDCPVIVDMGGGYGGTVVMRLEDNGLGKREGMSSRVMKFNGAMASAARTKDGSLAFVNKRAEVYWRMREELDPDQPGGSVIALPPDPELRADLAAPTWTLRPNGILIESKDDLRKRLGRSPGKGDACVMALDGGLQSVKRQMKRGTMGQMPTVNIGYAAHKQKFGVKR